MAATAPGYWLLISRGFNRENFDEGDFVLNDREGGERVPASQPALKRVNKSGSRRAAPRRPPLFSFRADFALAHPSKFFVYAIALLS